MEKKSKDIKKSEAKKLKVPKPKLIKNTVKRKTADILKTNNTEASAIEPRPRKMKLVLASDHPELLDPEMREAIEAAVRGMTQAGNHIQQKQELTREQQIMSRDLGVLETNVSEYLKSFMIIGYDINGDKISVIHARTPQEYDSIVEHARGTLTTILMKAQQNLPGMG